MNQPTNEQFEELKKRVEKLEQAQHQQIQLLRADVQETNLLLKRILPDVGTSREKLDTLDRGQQDLNQNQSAIFDALVKQIEDRANEIKTTQGTQNERFDHVDRRFDKIEATQTTQDAKLDQILQLLQQKPPEG